MEVCSYQIKNQGTITYLDKGNGELRTLDLEKTEVLNTFSSSVLVNEGDDEIPNFHICNNDNPLNIVDWSPDPTYFTYF